MSRVAALKPRFIARLRTLGVVAGTPTMDAVGRTIRAICDAPTLPTPFDVVGTILPTSAALVRRVPNHNLWLWFRVDDACAVFLMVTPAPPIPAD